MDDRYYLQQLKTMQDLNEKHLDGMCEILRTFLALQSTLLALLSALLPSMSPAITLRWLFLVALVLLLAGCLMSLIALYDLRDFPRRVKEVFHPEVLKALRENRPVNAVQVSHKKRTRPLAFASAVSFVLALAMLLTYATAFLFFS